MFKKIISSSLFIYAIIATPTTSSATEVGKPYIRGDIGYSAVAKNLNRTDYENIPKSSLTYGFGIGYKINQHFRSEFAINHRNNYKYSTKLESQSFDSTTYMLNGYADFSAIKNLSPYLTVGFGLANNNAHNFKQDGLYFIGKLKRSFAWQAGFGVVQDLGKNFSLDYGYKYIDLGKVTTQNISCENEEMICGDERGAKKGRLKAHDFLVSIIYKF